MLAAANYTTADESDHEIFRATVPENHYLRQVNALMDFERCRQELICCYDPTQGRPALEPVLLLKMEFLQFHYNLSDRQVVEQSHYNMAFRYFLGLSLRSPLPHHTSFTKFRERLGAETHQQVFDDIVAQAREHGLVKDRLRLKDATHVIANIAIPSTIALVAVTRQRLLDAVRPYAAARAATAEAHAEALHTTTADLSGAERLLQRVAHLRSIVCWVDLLVTDLGPAAAEDGQRQSLAEALRLAHKVLSDREEAKATDQLVRVHDADARTGYHGSFYVGYKLDVATDGDSEIITALNVLPANGDEAADATTLITQEEQAHGNDVHTLSIDAIGFRGSLLREWTDPQGLNLDVVVPPKNDAPPPCFTGEQFTLSASGDRLTCPAGHTAQNRARSSNDTGWVFRFPRSACQECPLRQQCLAEMPKRGGRAVFKSEYEEEIRAARAKAQTPEFEAVRRQHWRIERKLGEMVRWHGARRARYRGCAKVLLQGLMTGIVVNVKRVVHLVLARTVRAELAASG
jgi:transposase